MERVPLCKPRSPAKRIALVLFVSVLMLVIMTSGISLAAPGDTTRESVSSSGNPGNNHSFEPSISADGRYVAFSSDASNLVASDTNNTRDIFVRDRETGTTERVSVNSSGVQANDFSLGPSISADGRYVAYESIATNLVASDTNNTRDIFVRDRETGTTERVSVDSSGAQANDFSVVASISKDGRYVAFESVASNLVAGDTIRNDIFVRDRETGTTERVSVDSSGTQGNGPSIGPSMSADGRFVAFRSVATNLVSSSDTNRSVDAFVHDRQTGTTERVSVDSSGAQANNASVVTSISKDGRYVAFSSNATNLVADDTNNTSDAFVRDRQAGTTERISISSSGTQANGFSFDPSISADGRYVAFTSSASNLWASDTNNANDVFMRDRQAGTTRRVSLSSSGTQANGSSSEPFISADGRFVAFSSAATNLVAGDSGFNIRNHIFVNELGDVPPTINIPPAITQNATSPSGAEVSYTVTVTDDVDPNPTLSCDPASGSTFPIGTTTVTCTATDSSGNSAEANFDVVVKGAAEQISTLKEDVAVLGLQRGISQSLQAKLNDALAHLNADRTVPACNKLGEFISEVSAQSGKNIDPGDAQWLTTETNRIKAVLAC